jgi:hypothetical protein
MTSRWNSEQNYIEQLETRIRELERLKDQDQEAWFPESWRLVGTTNQPAFQNSWVNFGAPFTSAAFRKERGGIVRLRGVVKSGVATTVIWTLPITYRPPATLMFGVHGSGSEGRVDVTAAGAVQQQVGGNAYISLDGIAFVVA